MDLRHHSSTAALRPSFLAKIVVKSYWVVIKGGLLNSILLQSANVFRGQLNSIVFKCTYAPGWGLFFDAIPT